MGHTDIKTTMIYVSLGKSHIREQVEKLNRSEEPPRKPARHENPHLNLVRSIS
jgi:hypothetical protein